MLHVHINKVNQDKTSDCRTVIWIWMVVDNPILNSDHIQIPSSPKQDAHTC